MRPFHKLRIPFLAVLLAVSAGATAPRTARAQSLPAAEQGRNHFNAAVTLFREGDYRGALVEFRRSYELSNNYRALYNIAQAEYELQDYAAALRSFERYLLEGSTDIDAERRVAVKAELARLATRVAKLEVKTSAVGADVLVDDVVVGKTPLPEALVVSAGRRKIVVQKADFLPFTQFVELAGGDVSSVVVELAPKASPAVAPEPPQPSSPSRAPLWISVTATGLLAAGAVTTGILALGAHSDAESTLRTRGVSARDVDSAHAKSANLALAADILTGAAIAMGVVTVVLLVRGKGPEEARAAALRGPGAILGGTF
jgi:tetratricopeptide (TPR) repeat protein